MKRFGKILPVIGLILVVIFGVAWGILYGTSVAENSADIVQDDIQEILSQTDTDESQIVLNEDGISVSGTGVSVEENTALITQAGTYAISGTMDNGQVYISAGDEDTVILSLRGIDLSNETDAAIYVDNSGLTMIVLEDGAVNRIQSGTESVISEPEDTADQGEGAAIYARDNLSITGTGTLQVFGYINNGIHTTNNLVIDSGIYEVTARNNAVKGKDSVSVTGGNFTIISGGDGIQSDDTTGEGYGEISISDGSFAIQAFNDGIQAQTLLDISGGDFNITTGNGNGAEQDTDGTQNLPDADWDREDTGTVSMKGLKSDDTILLSGGTFSIDTEDDGIHANHTIQITDGEFRISSGDDGIHADHTLIIENGDIQILQSYEGLEANQIRLSGGTISIVSSDDGINAYGGQSSWGWGGGGSSDAPEDMPNLYLSGSTVTVNAEGDGLDSNGNIFVEDGLIMIDGPTGNWEGAIDYGVENGGSCVITGGTFLAVGSAGMSESFEETSEQISFTHRFDFNIEAGTEIVITDSQRNTLIEHTAEKRFALVTFSSPELSEGETVNLRAGNQSVEIQLDSVSATSGEQPRWGW